MPRGVDIEMGDGAQARRALGAELPTPRSAERCSQRRRRCRRRDEVEEDDVRLDLGSS